MQKRFGGLLALALGVVLIGNGLSGALAGTVGAAPVATCGAAVVDVGSLPPVLGCPEGAITVSSTSPAGVTQPADGWTVTLTSTCLDSTGGQPVNRTLDVPDGSPVIFEGLYAYPLSVSPAGQPCLYTLTQTAVPGVTATFDPASPFALGANRGGYATTVNLTHAAVAPSTSAAPSTSTAPSSSASASPTEESRPASASASAAAAPIAETGPSQPVKASLWWGIGLVLLGLFLTFEGRVRTFARHRR